MGESQIPDFDRGSSGHRGSGAPHVDSCADATGHLRPPSDGSAAGNASKESHSDGRITVESEPGRTVFALVLPAGEGISRPQREFETVSP